MRRPKTARQYTLKNNGRSISMDTCLGEAEATLTDTHHSEWTVNHPWGSFRMSGSVREVVAEMRRVIADREGEGDS